MVQMAEANRIEDRWKRAGSPPCAEHEVEKEYHLSSDTGDYRCTECGETFTRSEMKERRRGGGATS